MARGPYAGRGATTIVAPVGSQTQATRLSGAQSGLRKLFFTSKDLAQPDRLYQVLSKMQDFVSAALHPLAQNPLLSGNLLRGLVFTHGVTQYLQHGLGRAYQGYYCVRAQGGYANFLEIAPNALPTGLTTAQVLGLTSAHDGTFDFWIF